MKRSGINVAVGLALAIALPISSAHAQQPRTFVSPTGSDSNNCTLAAPCRTFQVAITQTNAGGEIAVLGTAGYNAGATFNIDRPISIVNPGGFEAGIEVPSGGNGITFTTSGAVYLKGLTIEGGGTGQVGVFYSGVAGSLTIQDCVIRNVASNGITFEPFASSSLTMSDTYVANNGVFGIFVGPTGGHADTVTAVFDRVESDNNGQNGFTIAGQSSTGTINATATDSVAAGNSDIGFQVTGGAALLLFRSVAANNNTGIAAFGGATLWVGQSTVTGNATSWQTVSSGVIQSAGTNLIVGNAAGQTQLPAITGGSN
jgi:hypothetical protein